MEAYIKETITLDNDTETNIWLRTDDYVDVLPLAEELGKNVDDWFELKNMDETRLHVEECFGLDNGSSIQLVLDPSGVQQSLWVYSELVPFFISWLNPSLHIQVNGWLERLKIEKKTKFLEKRIEGLKDMIVGLSVLQVEQVQTIKTLKGIDDDSNVPIEDPKSLVVYIATTKEYAKRGLFKLGTTSSRIDTHFIALNESRFGDDLFCLVRFIKTNNIDVFKYLQRYLNKYLVQDSPNWFKMQHSEICDVFNAVDQVYYDMPHLFDYKDWTPLDAHMEAKAKAANEWISFNELNLCLPKDEKK